MMHATNMMQTLKSSDSRGMEFGEGLGVSGPDGQALQFEGKPFNP